MRLLRNEKALEAAKHFPVRGEIRASLLGAGIYVVGFSDYLKIGMSDRLIDRLLQLQESAPDQLILYATLRGGRELEAQLLGRFSMYRTRGEWFRHAGILKEWTDVKCVMPFYRLTSITGGLRDKQESRLATSARRSRRIGPDVL
jgi:hypothetical protein